MRNTKQKQGAGGGGSTILCLPGLCYPSLGSYQLVGKCTILCLLGLCYFLLASYQLVGEETFTFNEPDANAHNHVSQDCAIPLL